jgi:RHS repeat-associated protein
MLMPGRNTQSNLQGGFSSGGTTTVNGNNYVSNLTVTTRIGNTPNTYKAATSIEFIGEYVDNGGEEYEAFIVNQTNPDPNPTTGTVSSNNDDGYRYGFNGKENDKDISEGDLDFGARIYDSRLGRWLALDPLMKKYPNETPYFFSGGNPIFFQDADGKDRIQYYVIFDERTGKTALIPGKTINQKDLMSVHNVSYEHSGIVETSKWYDIEEVHYIKIDKNGRTSQKVIEERGEYRTTTSDGVLFKGQWWANLSAKNKPKQEGTVPNGIIMTREVGSYEDAKFNKKSQHIDAIISLDLLMSSIASTRDLNSIEMEKIAPRIMDILENTSKIIAGGTAVKDAWENVAKEFENRDKKKVFADNDYVMCEACGGKIFKTNKKDSILTKDTTNKKPTAKTKSH